MHNKQAVQLCTLPSTLCKTYKFFFCNLVILHIEKAVCIVYTYNCRKAKGMYLEK